MDKSHTSHRPKIACCAIMKNEGPYIHEWVAHYKNLGFDEICIYENDSSDNSRMLLEDLSSKGLITHVSWPSLDRNSPQISAYSDFLEKTSSDWVLFCDADEFLVLHNNDCIHDLMDNLEDQVTQVCVNWRIFGSSGHESKSDDLVLSRFQNSSEKSFQINRHVKSFVRPCSVIEMHIHAPLTKGACIYPDGTPLKFNDGEQGIAPEIKLDVASIHHYFTRSREEWNVKKGRGNANRASNARDKYIRYHEGMFVKHDRNEIENKDAVKYIGPITLLINKFK